MTDNVGVGISIKMFMEIYAVGKLTHIRLVQKEPDSGGSRAPFWEAWTMTVCSSTAQGSSVEEDTGWVMSGAKQTWNNLSVAGQMEDMV